MARVSTWTGEIKERDLLVTAARSSGPGGQNVNKVSTKAVIRFNIWENETLSLEQKQIFFDYLNQHYPSRISGEPSLEYVVIQNSNSRSLEKNKQQAISILSSLISESLVEIKPRKKTKPTYGAIQKRLQQKRRDSQIKKTRSGHSGHSHDD